MEFVPAVALAALVIKLVDFFRYIAGRDRNGVITQLFAWIAGVAAVFLAAQTDWAAELIVGEVSLARMSAWSQLFVGLTVGSGASLLKDGLLSLDNRTSAAVPHLLNRPRSGPPPEAW